MPMESCSLFPVEPVVPRCSLGPTNAVQCRLTITMAFQSRLTRMAAFAYHLSQVTAVESGLSSLDEPHLHSRTLTVTLVGHAEKSTTGPTSTPSPVTPVSTQDTQAGPGPLRLASLA